MENQNHIIIRPSRACEIVGVSRITLWRWEREGNFCKSIPLGANSKGFWLDEVLAWLESRRTSDETAAA